MLVFTCSQPEAHALCWRHGLDEASDIWWVLSNQPQTRLFLETETEMIIQTTKRTHSYMHCMCREKIAFLYFCCRYSAFLADSKLRNSFDRKLSGPGRSPVKLSLCKLQSPSRVQRGAFCIPSR